MTGPRSTTAALAGWSLGAVVALGVLIVLVALRDPEVAPVVVPALAQVALAVAGGGAAGTVAYGARHFGARVPPSALWGSSGAATVPVAAPAGEGGVEGRSRAGRASAASTGPRRASARGGPVWPGIAGQPVRLEDEP